MRKAVRWWFWRREVAIRMEADEGCGYCIHLEMVEGNGPDGDWRWGGWL